MRYGYRSACLLFALCAGACSGTALDSESVAARDESLTAVPMPAPTATITPVECVREWLVEAPGTDCPEAFVLNWYYGRVVVPSTDGKSYCAYISRQEGGNRNGPFPGGVQAPLRSDCSFAARGHIPSATPLPKTNCHTSHTCGLPVVESTTPPFGAEGGGRPVYFNFIGRTLSVFGAVARVRLHPSVSAIASSLGVLPADADAFQYEIPDEGFYQLTDGPSEVAYVEYQRPGEANWTVLREK